MSKPFQFILVLSVGLIAISFFYYLVIRPIQKDQPLRECEQLADRGLVDAKARFEKAASENKISDDEKSDGIMRASTAYSQMKDECRNKY